ncbi:hypothetical protein BJ878DRAFT_247593 [Calycina marina]|uniref:CCHC-type domain-containing protein n=1 Tax=Calycina marina TaxID=1763456 RepID=A0A9P7Z7M1_9HELO|nr:hypothetical protein BJ878DRAFT_247593 [Calycina marina]
MEEGHVAFECKNPRKISYDNVDDVPGEVAWNKMKAASDEGDLDDFKEALNEYCKATPDATYVQLESGFRLQGFTFFLIAIKKQLEETFTNMDLQGNLGKTFSVSIRKSDKHQRPKEKELWPSSPEENMARLEDAGTPVNRGISRCRNCFSLEHQAKACPKEVVEKPKVEVFCFNCEQPGHRVRDCRLSHCLTISDTITSHCLTVFEIIADQFIGPQARPDRFACRNCGKSNHSSKECPEYENACPRKLLRQRN